MNTTMVPTSLLQLQARLQGEVICPGDERYDDARRVWNGRIDRFPCGIVYCTDSDDVRSVIEFAREAEIPLSIRGGGHSMIGLSVCDNGLVIDLSQMKGITVHPHKAIARAQAGLTLGEFVHEIQRYGLATTTGTVSGTGIGGLTLGGGIGWLMGKYGLTVDNLLSVDLVTADGQFLTVSASEHSDLFWGVRGGGGNFGVVTSLTFQLHPIDTVLAGKISYPLSQAREILRFYHEFTRSAPDELTAYVALNTTLHGIPVISISLCYSGPIALGERLIAPLRSIGTPLADLIHTRPYLQSIASNAGAPSGRHYYEQAVSLQELSDDAIDLIADYGAARTSPFSQVLIQHVHGEARRVSSTATAFALREVPYVMNIVAEWNAEDAQQTAGHVAWVKNFRAALHPLVLEGVYINFLGEEGEEQLRASYNINYERLVALKDRYDPDNVFHCNQNIKPTLWRPMNSNVYSHG